MITFVIPTLNEADSLARLLDQCGDNPIVVADGGSNDDTVDTALRSSAVVALGTTGRGTQLRRGVDWAFNTHNAEWLLVVHADCMLPDDWEGMVSDHIAAYPEKAAYFTFGANASGWQPRFMEFVVRLRDIWPRLPYGDQGLLISRAMYEAVGGYPDQPLFEDVEIIRAIKRQHGKSALRRLDGRIMTDVSCYQRYGYARRTWRNLMIIRDYNKGTPIQKLRLRYSDKPSGGPNL